MHPAFARKARRDGPAFSCVSVPLLRVSASTSLPVQAGSVCEALSVRRWPLAGEGGCLQTTGPTGAKAESNRTGKCGRCRRSMQVDAVVLITQGSAQLQADAHRLIDCDYCRNKSNGQSEMGAGTFGDSKREKKKKVERDRQLCVSARESGRFDSPAAACPGQLSGGGLVGCWVGPWVG